MAPTRTRERSVCGFAAGQAAAVCAICPHYMLKLPLSVLDDLLHVTLSSVSELCTVLVSILPNVSPPRSTDL